MPLWQLAGRVAYPRRDRYSPGEYVNPVTGMCRVYFTGSCAVRLLQARQVYAPAAIPADLRSRSVPLSLPRPRCFRLCGLRPSRPSTGGVRPSSPLCFSRAVISRNYSWAFLASSSFPELGAGNPGSQAARRCERRRLRLPAPERRPAPFLVSAEDLSGPVGPSPITINERLINRSIERRWLRSLASQNEIAMPAAPARAVRPIRCT